MSSQLEATSAILGEYMLKGWTLTDLHCEECRVTPLMREPEVIAIRQGRDRIQFCALCDGPAGDDQTRESPQAAPLTARSPIPTPSTKPAESPPPSSRQTPLLDKADHDLAAERISHLLLQGYSLLSATCPHASCRGIPLVGYPKREGGASRRLCVGCDTRWHFVSRVKIAYAKSRGKVFEVCHTKGKVREKSS
ncbi:hypothetical protein M231_07749 [Tremella mesenterica]|uniref:Uncharacterized protein n=1 Tax=Tremella mesenterica TaxID=5217 RepID=A0A4Q1BDP8_TREME|nr:hypothetical protein M231_07749 [Tremella mesenterica]